MIAVDLRPVFVDTNILVYARLALSPQHADALSRLRELEAQRVPLWLSRQVLREYLAAMTRPGALTGSIAIGSLLSDVLSFSQRFTVAEDSQAVTDRLLLLLSAVTVAGAQIHDANIVATMQAYKIERLLTHNTADFARFAGSISLMPLDLPIT